MMKIAVTYENGQVFQHFGHTQQFKLYEVENGELVSSWVVDTNGSGHGALAGFLRECGAEVLICGGIGGGNGDSYQDYNPDKESGGGQFDFDGNYAAPELVIDGKGDDEAWKNTEVLATL